MVQRLADLLNHGGTGLLEDVALPAPPALIDEGTLYDPAAIGSRAVPARDLRIAVTRAIRLYASFLFPAVRHMGIVKPDLLAVNYLIQQGNYLLPYAIADGFIGAAIPVATFTLFFDMHATSFTGPSCELLANLEGLFLPWRSGRGANGDV
ncbi:MAG: hypothetical protein A2075_16565 [Geobacteraceae bacterium GWC2_58_44]|nr:MAG: hypothetical protein A2075_16565 [Geobacteraceae bacterium GWC2_58_44]